MFVWICIYMYSYIFWFLLSKVVAKAPSSELDGNQTRLFDEEGTLFQKEPLDIFAAGLLVAEFHSLKTSDPNTIRCHIVSFTSSLPRLPGFSRLR